MDNRWDMLMVGWMVTEVAEQWGRRWVGMKGTLLVVVTAGPVAGKKASMMAEMSAGEMGDVKVAMMVVEMGNSWAGQKVVWWAR